MKAFGLDAVGEQDFVPGQQHVDVGDFAHGQVDGHAVMIDQIARRHQNFGRVKQVHRNAPLDQHPVFR